MSLGGERGDDSFPCSFYELLASLHGAVSMEVVDQYFLLKGAPRQAKPAADDVVTVCEKAPIGPLPQCDDLLESSSEAEVDVAQMSLTEAAAAAGAMSGAASPREGGDEEESGDRLGFAPRDSLSSEDLTEVLSSDPKRMSSFRFAPVLRVEEAPPDGSSDGRAYVVTFHNVSGPCRPLIFPQSVILALIKSITSSSTKFTPPHHQSSSSGVYLPGAPSAVGTIVPTVCLTADAVAYVISLTRCPNMLAVFDMVAGSRGGLAKLRRVGRSYIEEWTKSAGELARVGKLAVWDGRREEAIEWTMERGLEYSCRGKGWTVGSMLGDGWKTVWKKVVENSVKKGKGAGGKEVDEEGWRLLKGQGTHTTTQQAAKLLCDLSPLHPSAITLVSTLSSITKSSNAIQTFVCGFLSQPPPSPLTCSTPNLEGFKQFLGFCEGVKQARRAVEAASRLEEEARSVDEEGKVVDMAEGMVSIASSNLAGSLPATRKLMSISVLSGCLEVARSCSENYEALSASWATILSEGDWTDDEVASSRLSSRNLVDAAVRKAEDFNKFTEAQEVEAEFLWIKGREDD